MEGSLRTKNIVEGTPYVSKGFKSALTEDLRLKIFISQNQFQFLIADRLSTVLYIHPFELSDGRASFFTDTSIKEVTHSIDELERKFSNVSVGIFTPDFTLVPEEMVSKDTELFFRTHLLPGNSSGNEFYMDRLHQVNASLLYSMPQEMMHSFHEKFPMYSYQHCCSAQIRNLSPRNQAMNVYAIIQNKWLQIICLTGHQLKFANAFSFKTAEDFIYYVLAVYGQLNLNPENVPLILFGEVMKDSTLYEIAIKYVRYVKPGKTTDTWRFEDDYPFPLHFYSTLFSL